MDSDIGKPRDLVEGIDPAFTLTPIQIPGARCTCGYEGPAKDMAQHMLLAHPKNRSAEFTCHCTPIWDHERWCVRTKGHPGDHWTPSLDGGRTWPRRDGELTFWEQRAAWEKQVAARSGDAS